MTGVDLIIVLGETFAAGAVYGVAGTMMAVRRRDRRERAEDREHRARLRRLTGGGKDV